MKSSDKHTAVRRRHWPRRLGVASGVLACALGALWIYANRTARARVAEQLTEATGLPASVESASILWSGGVVARQIVLGSPEHPVSTIDELLVRAPLRTLATSPEIQHLHVQGARLRLHADDDGEIKWPFTTKQATPFPPEGVTLDRASFQLSQNERTPWEATGISGSIRPQSDSGTLQIDLQIDELAAAQWTLVGSVGADRQAELQAASTRVAFDANDWSQRPLVPSWVDQLPVTFRGAVTVNARLDAQQGPGTVDIQLANGQLHIQGTDRTFREVTAEARLSPRRIEVSSFQASSESTELSGRLTANAVGSSFMGDWQLRCVDLPLEILAEHHPRLEGLQGQLGGELKGEFLRRSSTIRSTCQGPVTLANAKYREASIPNVATTIQLDQATFPLDDPTNVQAWIIVGSADCDSFLFAGERFQHVNADVQFHQGRLIVSGEAALNADDSRYLFGLDAHLGNDDSSGKIMVAGQQVSATSLLASASRISTSLTGRAPEFPPIQGEITFDAVVELPSTSLDDISQWSGSIHAHSPALQLNESTVHSLHVVGQLSDSAFELTKCSARIGSKGRLLLVGEAPVTGPGDVSLKVSGQQVSLDDALRLGFGDSFKLSPMISNSLIDRPWTPTDGHESLIDGTITWHGRIEAPRSRLADVLSWDVNGTIELDQLVIHGEPIERCVMDVAISDRTVRLESVDVRFSSGGRIRGMGTVPLESSGMKNTTQVNADWVDLPLSVIDRFLPIGRAVAGATTGRLRVEGSARSWNDVRGLSGNARMIFHDVTLGGDLIGSYNAIVDLSPSENVVLKAWNRQGTPKLQIQTTVGRDVPHRLKADLLIVDAPLQDFVPRDWLVDERFTVQGGITTRSRFVGTLVPLQLAASGRASLRSVEVGAESLPDMSVRFRTHPEQGSQLELRAEGLGGVAKGHLDLPWVTNRVPQATLSFQGLQASQLQHVASKMLPPGIELTGELSGSAHFISWNNPSQLVAEVQTKGLTAQVRGIPINPLTLQLRRDEATTHYTASGQVLEGDLTVEGSIPSSQAEWPARVTLKSARLEQLPKYGPRFRSLDQLAGEVELNVDVSFDSESQQLAGSGTIAVRDVSWRRERLVPRADARVTLQDGVLQVTELDADVAQGVISGRLTVPLAKTQLSNFELTARRMALDRTLTLFNQGNHAIRGTWNGRFSGSLGSTIVGRGQVEMRNVTVNRMPLSAVRVPITYLIDTRRWDGRLKVQRAQARAAGGQISADAVVSFGRQKDFELDVDLARVDTALLTQNLTGASTYDQGRLSGKLQLRARRFQSLRDLEGTFRGELEDARSMRLPVFSDLVSFANVSQLSREPFDSETLSVRISRGIISTPGVVLRSNGAEVFVQGKMDVNTRLDFDVALQSGNVSPDFGLSELLRSPAATLAVPGVAVPLQVLDFLQDRVLYLHVGGTVRRPSFQIRTDRQIQQELIRYYLPTMTLPASRTNR